MGNFFLTSPMQLSRPGSVAHLLTLIVSVLTVSLHGQWFWLGWGWVMVLGQGSLFNSLSPFPPPLLPFIPPAHPSILFQPFGQLSLNPANHRLGWSVGNQASPWLCSTQTYTESGNVYNMKAREQAWILGEPTRLKSQYGRLFLLWSLIPTFVCSSLRGHTVQASLPDLLPLMNALPLMVPLVCTGICTHPPTCSDWGS